jgi:macrodomain Ter protein organizer (MatP/YcbG family)
MLVHKSIDVRPEIWRRLRINAELSGAAVRDYLAYVIERAEPVADATGHALLQEIAVTNRASRIETQNTQINKSNE